MFSPTVPPSIRAPIGSVEDQVAAAAVALLRAPDRTMPDESGVNPWLRRVVTSLDHNLSSGRYANVCLANGSAPLTLLQYAKRVSACLMAEWELLEALRAGDAKTWSALLLRLERKAYFWVGAAGRAAWARAEAADVAAKTCADIWEWLQRHPFPFDVPFDRWVDCVLRYRLLEAARIRAMAARHIVDSLDHPHHEDGHTRADQLPSALSDTWLEAVANYDALRRALARLTKRQARVIRLWYLESWTAEEIAAALRVTVGNVYVLKHRGLQNLRHDPALADYCGRRLGHLG